MRLGWREMAVDQVEVAVGLVSLILDHLGYYVSAVLLTGG